MSTFRTYTDPRALRAENLRRQAANPTASAGTASPSRGAHQARVTSYRHRIA